MSTSDGCQRQDGLQGNAVRMEEQQSAKDIVVLSFFRTVCSPGLPRQVDERGIKVYPKVIESVGGM